MIEPNKYKKPVRELAKEWHISTASVTRYADRGCPWTESDKEIASWMRRKLHKKSPKLRAKAAGFFPTVPAPVVEATTEIDESCEMRDDLTSEETVEMIKGLLKWSDLNQSIHDLCEPLERGDMEGARQLGRLEKEVEILRAEMEQYFKSGI